MMESKEHSHTYDSNGKCSCGHDHTHNHDIECTTEEHHTHTSLYGKSDEIPAVFSNTVKLVFENGIGSGDLKNRLVDRIESLKRWVSQNKYYIGHIKIFAEDGEGANLWLSTTGKDINIKETIIDGSSKIKQCTVHITAIVVGADEKELRAVTLELLHGINS